MAVKAKYAHTNIIAQDWKQLVKFYVNVFGCTPAPPERDHQGAWIEQVTGMQGVRIRGLHLRLPGYGADGPTLEIFTYNQQQEDSGKTLNRPGFAHIAFEVDDVVAARRVVLAQGGQDIGEIVTREIPGAGKITLIYMTDPEGNILELQSWN